MEHRLEELGAPKELPAMTPTQYMKFDMLRFYDTENNDFDERAQVVGETASGEPVARLEGDLLSTPTISIPTSRRN